MTRILLIRHGSTDWNEAGRLQGQLDIPLNAKGLAQANTMAARLAGADITAIYASDLQRARQTAAPLARALSVPVQTDARLREVYLGEWQGKLTSEVETPPADAQRYAGRFTYPAAMAPPGGETALQVQQRLLAAVREIATRCPQQTVAIVTHGFAVAVLLSYFRNIPLDEVWGLVPSNGEINLIEV